MVLGQMRDSRKADRRPSGKSPAVAHFGPIHIPSRLKQLWDEIDPVPLKAATTAGLGGLGRHRIPKGKPKTPDLGLSLLLSETFKMATHGTLTNDFSYQSGENLFNETLDQFTFFNKPERLCEIRLTASTYFRGCSSSESQAESTLNGGSNSMQ